MLVDRVSPVFIEGIGGRGKGERGTLNGGRWVGTGGRRRLNVPSCVPGTPRGACIEDEGWDLTFTPGTGTERAECQENPDQIRGFGWRSVFRSTICIQATYVQTTTFETNDARHEIIPITASLHIEPPFLLLRYEVCFRQLNRFPPAHRITFTCFTSLHPYSDTTMEFVVSIVVNGVTRYENRWK